MNQRAAFRFFKTHAGYVVGQQAMGALDLARAEAYATEHDWLVDWEPDEFCDCAYDTDSPCDGSECYSAVLKDADGNVLGSLGCICEPSSEYRRVIDAELASEAMHDETACVQACAL